MCKIVAYVRVSTTIASAKQDYERQRYLLEHSGIELEGGQKMNPYTWMTVSQFFIQDEFLKRQIGYNTSNALQRKKEQGVVLGAPRTYDDSVTERIKELRASGLSMQKIADELGVSKTTVARLLK